MKFAIPVSLILFAFAASIGVGIEQANAIGQRFPTIGGTYPNSNEATTVALSSYTEPQSSIWGLDTATTEYKVYVPISWPNDRIDLTIEYGCEGNNQGGYDIPGRDYEHSSGVSQTRWWLYETGADEETRGTPIDTINSYDVICGATGITSQILAVDTPADFSTQSAVPGHQSYRVYVVRAVEINTSGIDGAGKGFRILAEAPPSGQPSALVTPREFSWDGNSAAGVQVNNDITTIDFPESRAFALFKGDRTDGDSNYTFRFRSDCRMENDTTVFLKWFDADVGTGNQDTFMRLRLYNERSGSYETLEAYRTPDTPDSAVDDPEIWLNANVGSSYNGGLINDGGRSSYVEEQELNGGVRDSSQYGVASFTAYRDTTYRIEWTGVDTTNALQFWLPFSEFNSTVTCPDALSDIEATCEAVTGFYKYDLLPTEKFDIKLQYRLESEASDYSGQPVYTVRADDPDSTGGNNGFTHIVPAADLSFTEQTYVRAYVVAPGPGGGRDYLASNLLIDSGPCGTYDYDPVVSSAAGGNIKPGDTITISSTVVNTDEKNPSLVNVDGEVYDHTIEVQDVTGPLDWRANALRDLDVISWNGTAAPITQLASRSGVRWEDRAGIAAGGSVTRSVTYRVSNEAQDGDEICWQASVSQNAGENPRDNTDTTQLPDAEDSITFFCITIYNQRFGLTVVPPSSPTIILPGETIPFAFAVNNFSAGDPDDSFPAAAPCDQDIVYLICYPGASLGDAPGTTYSVSVSNGTASGLPGTNIGTIAAGFSATLDGNLSANSGAQPGDLVCVNITVPLRRGFSDGTQKVAESVISQFCVVVAEQPYFTVDNNDVWAGGVFADASGCLSPPSITSGIQSVSGLGRGSLGEYAAYALGLVDGFGSNGSIGNTSLTFANVPSLGNLGAPPRCIRDYFNDLNKSTVGGFPLNPLFGGGQYYFSSDLPINSAPTISSRVTFIVEGDVFINTDITYSSGNYDLPLGSGGVEPAFMLVALGNIYIADNVTQLDGFYVAQPDPNDLANPTGIIDTCTDGAGNAYADLATVSVCDDNLLTFNGAVIAQRINFRRTRLGLLRNGPAETFVFSPEMYLIPPLMILENPNVSASLPIQSIRDLPPIY